VGSPSTNALKERHPPYLGNGAREEIILYYSHIGSPALVHGSEDVTYRLSIGSTIIGDLK